MNKLNSHNMQLGVEATIFDKEGNMKEKRFLPTSNSAFKNSIYAEVKDANNNIIETQEIPFRSYLYNFMSHFYYAGFAKENAPSGYGVLDTLNGEKTQFASSLVGRTRWNINAAGNASDTGIIIGSGSSPVSASQWKLDGRITNGSGSGQIYYANTIFLNVATSGSGYKTTAVRTFSNYSTESILVKEIGLVATMSWWSGVNSVVFQSLIARDVMDITGSALNISIPISGTLTINYNFESNPQCGLNKNWTTFYYYDMQDATAWTDIINIVSSSGAISYQADMFYCDTSTTGSLKGIVCGSGSAAVSMEDFRIGLIQNGTGAGQLIYGTHISLAPAPRSATTSSGEFSMRRGFTNSSGGSVDINEVAIYASDDNTYPITTTDCWMYSRFLTSGITLNDGETAEFRFVFSFIFQ